jgi:hypothetical protein
MIFLLLGIIPLITACDPQRLRQCEWYITPNPKADINTPKGMVSVCVSNFTTKRERCFFIIDPQTAEKFNGIKFKYSEMEYDAGVFPKKIEGLTACEGSH